MTETIEVQALVLPASDAYSCSHCGVVFVTDDPVWVVHHAVRLHGEWRRLVVGAYHERCTPHARRAAPARPAAGVPDCTCWLCTEEHRRTPGADLSAEALLSSANLFMSRLPDNNRPTDATDVHAARQIVAAYLRQVLAAPAPEPVGEVQPATRTPGRDPHRLSTGEPAVTVDGLTIARLHNGNIGVEHARDRFVVTPAALAAMQQASAPAPDADGLRCTCVGVELGTYANAVALYPPPGLGITRVPVTVDRCIADEVQALWARGIGTTGSCCGHGGEAPPIISVRDADVPAMRALGYEQCERRPNAFTPKFRAPDSAAEVDAAVERVRRRDSDDPMAAVVECDEHRLREALSRTVQAPDADGAAGVEGDIITEDIALALSDLQRASQAAGECGYGPSRARFDREEREAREEVEREITKRLAAQARAAEALLAKAALADASGFNEHGLLAVGNELIDLRARLAEAAAERATALDEMQAAWADRDIWRNEAEVAREKAAEAEGERDKWRTQAAGAELVNDEIFRVLAPPVEAERCGGGPLHCARLVVAKLAEAEGRAAAAEGERDEAHRVLRSARIAVIGALDLVRRTGEAGVLDTLGNVLRGVSAGIVAALPARAGGAQVLDDA